MKGTLQKIVNRIFHLEIEGHGKDNPILLRLTQTQEFTKVDFGYTTTNKYINGGWIKMSPDTYIEDTVTQKRYKMLNASGITISPNKHNFQSNKDWQYYSLYFEPLPQKDCTINLIEKEKGTLNDFNYYNIPIIMKDGIEMVL
jgi:hypothetical protein